MTKKFKVEYSNDSFENNGQEIWTHIDSKVIFTIKNSNYLNPNYLINIKVPKALENQYEDIIRDFLLVYLHRSKKSLEGFGRDIIQYYEFQ